MFNSIPLGRYRAKLATLHWVVLATTLGPSAPLWSQDRPEPHSVIVNEIGVVRESGDPLGVTVAGSHAFLCAADDGLHVFDISNPHKPLKVGACTTLENAMDVVVRGRLAFVANGNVGFRVVDVSEPSRPKEIGGCATPGEAARVTLNGDTAFVAANGLQVIDVANPNKPKLVGSLEKPNALMRAIAVKDKVVYLGDKRGPLYVIDVSDPKHPKELAFLEIGETHGIALQGKHAYLADDDSGLHIVNVSDSKAPRKVWTHSQSSPAGFGELVAVAGAFLYVGCSEGAIIVFDIADPEFPIRVATYETHERLYGLCAADGYLFVNKSKGRLLILRTLANAGDLKAAISEHVRNLGSSDNQIFGQAHKSLVQIGSPAVPALIETINVSKNGYQRCLAALVLSEIKPGTADRPAVTRALLRALGEKGDWRLHSYAIQGLHEIEPVDKDVATVAVAFVNVLRDRSERPGVRASAADALWLLAMQRGNARTVVPLLRAALKNEDADARNLASHALDRLKSTWGFNDVSSD